MKTCGIFCVVLLAGSLAASAATEQWRVPVTGTVEQIVVDGAGGCAFIRNQLGTNYVVWLNKKGGTIYRSLSIGSSMLFGGIRQCTTKQLLFTDFTSVFGTPMAMMVQVNSKSEETPVVAIGGLLIGSPVIIPFTFNTLADKKGFFVFNVNTNTAVGAVVRYSFK